MKSYKKRSRRQSAEQLSKLRNKRSSQEQLAFLDNKLGVNVGAKKERGRLLEKINNDVDKAK